ncbi:hypothetical protein [Methanobrevibacter sp.]|uniref:hypothetical protein n=1 Tax=Methanobrevibacter sp. TaxID=66852 RepID=UPI0038694903
MVYGEIEKIMIDEKGHVTPKGHLLMSAERMMKYLTDEKLFLDNIDFSIKLLTYAQLIRDEKYTVDLRRKFMNNIERQFYRDIYKRKEYTDDEEEFMSAMTTLLLGREFYEECGLTDEDFEESLRNSNNKYIKEVMDNECD